MDLEKLILKADEGKENNNPDALTDEEAEFINDELEKEVEKLENQDAKLTTKQRKRLKSSTFCGPNRSFPVNDCAHYTAALRLIGRYKGPGKKSAIRACIMRRGRALGCKGAKKSDFVELMEKRHERLHNV